MPKKLNKTGDSAELEQLVAGLSLKDRRKLMSALLQAPTIGERPKSIHLGFGALEWKTIRRKGKMRDENGDWQDAVMDYGPYAYLRVWDKSGKKHLHHSFYLGGAPNPRTADLKERLLGWLDRGKIGQVRKYRAEQFPASRRERPSGPKTNLRRKLVSSRG